MLFNVVLDFIMSRIYTIDGGIEWLSGKPLKHLDYADDICLFAKDMDEMKRLTELVVEEAKKGGIENKYQEDRDHEDSQQLGRPTCQN